MNIKTIGLFGLLFLAYSCNKDSVVPVPSQGANAILKDTHALQQKSNLKIEGVYSVTSGSDKFGDQVIVKWNPTSLLPGHRSSLLIANSNGKHFIMDVGYLDSVVFIQGYWRDGYSDATGLCNMYISKTEGGTTLVTGYGDQKIIIRGAYGKESGLPDQTLTLEYARPLFSDTTKEFFILAHRCGGRNSDRLPVSENSIAMVKYTESLGTTGVELDPRISSDGVPFIYHDADINIRLTQKGPLAGDVAAYTWYQLSNFVRLIHGEKIPSVEELLMYVIDSTSLKFVYLDMKSAEAVPAVIAVQKRAMDHAIIKNRNVLIVMGIPTTDVLNALLEYPEYEKVPSLCELSIDEFKQAKSVVWAPRWTLGTQNDLVEQVHNLNEKNLAVCWTIDSPSWIADYIKNGQFNGLLTNYPYVEAYYHYIQE